MKKGKLLTVLLLAALVVGVCCWIFRQVMVRRSNAKQGGNTNEEG